MTDSTIEEALAESIEDNDSIEIIRTDNPYRDEPLPRAKPHERITGGMNPEDMFGLLADAIDDEFLKIVLGCRGRAVPRGVLS